MRIVRDLAWELHPHLQRSSYPSLDDDLDQDLGIDSLGRSELVLRIDRAFKVRLPDRILAEADTPRDLLTALLEAAPHRADIMATEAKDYTSLPEVEASHEAATLNEALAVHVAAHGDRPSLFLWQSEEEEEAVTYADLDMAGRRIAAGLIERGIQIGDRVAIMLPTEASFFQSFFGVLYAGAVPVPIYPPFRRAQVEDHLLRQAGILRNAGARLLIVSSEIRSMGELLFGLVDQLQVVETAEGLTAAEPLQKPVPANADTIALIQYTSGSTGDPKGVVLTHANLLANVRAMGEAVQASSADIFVSWLPLYHDMGLIGAWLATLYYGAPTIIMPPLAFLADPGRWLRTIGRHRATLSAAPNFAFELCCKSIHDEDITGLDLSSLRMLLNGAEPVSRATIDRFTQRFEKFGFKPGAMAPVYGLAENSVGLAFPPVGRLPIVDRVQRIALSRDGCAVPASSDDDTALEFVACGCPIPRHEIRIVDESGLEVPERTEGRLQFKGPSATAGYFQDEQKTRNLFDGEWLESGDRGYIAAGDVYITGRIKDMIIKAGRNIYPQELEEVVGNVKGVRRGCVAAISTKDQRAGTERLVLLVETRLRQPEELSALSQEIIEASSAALDVLPDDVVLVPPHTVPKTSSGKIRRSSAKLLYEKGILSNKGTALWWQIARLAIAGAGNRARRIGRQFVALLYAAYWWLLLVMMAVPVWLLVMLLPKRSWRHAAIHQAAKIFLALTGSFPAQEAVTTIPAEHVLIAVNHSSYLDSAVLISLIKGPLAFVAKEALASQWVAGPFLRRIGTLFVRRADAAGGVEDTQNILQAAVAGERIVSYPEGTLTRMPGLLGFRLGIFMVAAETGTPVIPIAIKGTRSALRGGQWLPRHAGISVLVGKPIRADGTDFHAAVRLRDAIRGKILEMSGEPDLSVERVTIED